MLYELVYPAKNPMVMGLAYAVTRDIASFMRHQATDDAGNANPLALSKTEVGIRRAYSSGTSSTGMYQRDFLYLGFNEDESHHKVFDGVNIHIAGTHRLFANVEFADPNTYSRQDDRHDFLSTGAMPLRYAVTVDPVTGIRDGILKRPATDPVVIDTHTEMEYYEFRASLNFTDASGTKSIKLPANARSYVLSNFQHGGGDPNAAVPGPVGMCHNPTNPNYHGPTHRALLLALDAWADRGIEPPRSRHPDLEDGTLVTLEEASAEFPKIPGVQFPPFLNELEVLDNGPELFSRGGRLTVLPPLRGRSYKVLVPKVDRDGLDIAGVRPMEIRVPLGTNMGWNVRADGQRAPNLCGLTGSFIPFATTKTERLASGDPRLSLQERYGNHEGYVNAVRRAANEMVRERLLIPEDAQRFIDKAEQSSVLK